MNEKGIATLAIVVIVVVAVAAVGAGVYFFIGGQAGPGGGSGENQPDGELGPQADQPFEWASDITPGSGEGTPPPGSQPGANGPWMHRVMSATSSDGLIWVKDDRIISDQASVPDAIVDNDGNIRVYYVDWYNGHVISVALSQDGVNWIYKKTSIAGEVAPTLSLAAVDPDIVLLSGGGYRLYYMYAGTIYSATSNYGINFVKEDGVRFQGEAGETWMDPDVVKMGDVWRMFTWKAIGDASQVISTVSSDGLSFTKENELTTVGNISCTIPVAGGYRMYYVGGGGVSSAFSSDGVSWTGEGLRLEGAADPAVIKLSDGTYKMFYKTFIK